MSSLLTRVRRRLPFAPKNQSNFDEDALIERFTHGLPGEARYAVDIAAGDGVSMSNTHALFASGWAGLAVEVDGPQFARLAGAYRRYPRVALAKCMVTPENIVSLLDTYRAPKALALLSLDIDGYDYFVLEALLRSYQPAVLCAEINEKIPPPIRFTVTYSPGYGWAGDHFYGQSLSQLHDLASANGYDLVALEYNNAFLIRREHNRFGALSPEAAYRQGYLDRPDRKAKFAYNANFEGVHGLPADKAVAFVKDFFAKYEGRFVCRAS